MIANARSFDCEKISLCQHPKKCIDGLIMQELNGKSQSYLISINAASRQDITLCAMMKQDDKK